MAKAFRILLGFILLTSSQSAFAHLTPSSEVTLAFEDGGISADIIVPAAEYAYASGNKADNSRAALEAAHDYVLHRIQIVGQSGRRWSSQIEWIRFGQSAGPPDLLARVWFSPPEGREVSGPVTLHWSIVTQEQADHFVLVSVGEGISARTIGALRQSNPEMAIERHASTLSSMGNAAWLGAVHIITGYDHLLFLIALLLVAPMVAHEGRWAARRGRRETAVCLLKIVTGFTVGHSATLIAAGLGGWRLPSAPVEIAIAVSVALTAVHAIRPIFPCREAQIAFGFGLVHGLAFATLIADADLDMSRNLATLAGFNLGIEAVQLAILLVVVPLYLASLRCQKLELIRPGIGVIISLSGLYWIFDRVPGIL